MSESSTPYSRRDFLKTSGAVGAGLVSIPARRYERILGANNRLQMGIIGCGRIGTVHLGELLAIREQENFEIDVVCDVWETRALDFKDRIWSSGGNPVHATDYREVLERDLDYVTIATPEHWHAPIALDALDAGMHVYCEKPMTHDIQEGFEVLDKVEETGLKMQVGVQGMSDNSYETANEAIRAGLLGQVIEAQIEYVRDYPMSRGPYRRGIMPDQPKPDDLDWDAWLGPAPDHEWSPARYFEWRNYLDYSGGIATDLFIHRLTRILKACGLGYPKGVVGMGGIYLWDDGREIPDNYEMLAEYPPVEGITPGMTVHLLGTMANNRGIDHLIRGTEATLEFTGGGWEIRDDNTGEIIKTHDKTGGENIGLHHKNHHAAIRDGAELHCPPELGQYGTVAVNGSMISWMDNKKVTWDSENREWV